MGSRPIRRHHHHKCYASFLLFPERRDWPLRCEELYLGSEGISLFVRAPVFSPHALLFPPVRALLQIESRIRLPSARPGSEALDFVRAAPDSASKSGVPVRFLPPICFGYGRISGGFWA